MSYKDFRVGFIDARIIISSSVQFILFNEYMDILVIYYPLLVRLDA